jgi:hypothetical protein
MQINAVVVYINTDLLYLARRKGNAPSFLSRTRGALI